MTDFEKPRTGAGVLATVTIPFQFAVKGAFLGVCLVQCLNLWTCLEFPQPAHVITALKARRHQALVQTGLDAGQTRGTCSDHGDSVHHGDW